MLGKEKIEALRGLGIRSSVSGAKNLSGSKTKPNSAIELPSCKDKSNSVISSLKSKSKAKGDLYLVILSTFLFFFLLSLFLT